jgi:hypothetical protein
MRSKVRGFYGTVLYLAIDHLYDTKDLAVTADVNIYPLPRHLFTISINVDRTALSKVKPCTVSFSLRVWVQAEVSWLPPCL